MTSIWFVVYVICCLRYGGLSFGQERRLVSANVTRIKHMLDQMASALQLDSQLFNNMTNVSMGNVVEDFSNIFGRLVTGKNVKVSYLQLAFLYLLLKRFCVLCWQLESVLRCCDTVGWATGGASSL